MNSFLIISSLPLLIALLGLFQHSRKWLPWVAAILMILQIFVVAWVCIPVFSGIIPSWGGWSIDGIGAAFAAITTLVATAAIVQGAFLLPAEREGHEMVSNRRFCLFYTLTGLFIIAMYAVLFAQNLGYLWMALEATTLMSAPLIYFHRSRHSLEATWKYLILCSVGIAFALFGIVLIYAAQNSHSEGGTMLFSGLIERAQQLDPGLLRFGYIFCLLGFGTKAGLFPIHNWLPDAHSEAPAPVSAMLSGALLNCALVAIWRLSQVMVAADQATLVHQLLIPGGAITVLAASLMLVRQHDLKRMWAYSSMEHVGLLTLAIGINSGPIFVLHAFNHSIVKVALFLLAGNILHLYGTKALSKLSGLLKLAPAWGITMLVASFAIAGSPPFGTFISEWLLLRDTFAAGYLWAAAAVIIGLTITCVAIAVHVGKVVFGNAPTWLIIRPSRAWAFVPALLMGISLISGFAISQPVITAITLLVQGGFVR